MERGKSFRNKGKRWKSLRTQKVRQLFEYFSPKKKRNDPLGGRCAERVFRRVSEDEWGGKH